MDIAITFGIVYLAGVFITACILGFIGVRDNPFIDNDYDIMFVAIFWPIMLPMMCIAMCGVICTELIETQAEKHPRLARKVECVIDVATLIFRPIAIGRRLRKFIEKRSKKSN